MVIFQNNNTHNIALNFTYTHEHNYELCKPPVFKWRNVHNFVFFDHVIDHLQSGVVYNFNHVFVSTPCPKKN